MSRNRSFFAGIFVGLLGALIVATLGWVVPRLTDQPMPVASCEPLDAGGALCRYNDVEAVRGTADALGASHTVAGGQLLVVWGRPDGGAVLDAALGFDD